MSLSKTERSESEPWEAEPQRVDRALRVIIAANKALVIASDVVSWLDQVCRTAVETGGYAVAWIGFAERDKQKIVRPVARAGPHLAYLDAATITWKDEPLGRGPTGTAIRTGKYCLSRNIPKDPAFDPWRQELVQHGIKSAIALPLSRDGRTFGALAMLAGQIDAFGLREIEVLSELAADLAYGLVVVFRTDVQRQSSRQALEECQTRLRHAERLSHLAEWVHDLDSDTVAWSDELYRILGLDPQKRITRFPQFLKLIHPDDRASVLKVAAEAAQSLEQFHMDYRIIRPNGELRYIHGEGEVIRDDAGKPRRTVGIIQDVTEQQLAKVALENANRSLEAKNIALQEILGNIEAERDKIGQRVKKNVQELVLPLLQSLEQGATRRQKLAIEQIDRSLQEIISPFLDKVAQAVKSLTPSELRICSFIKRGLSVKQIADLEHLSPETIAAHRRNIRRKLHISNRKINLTSYLRDVYRDPPAHST
jgi:PAS domain S-box-containing protein